VLAVCVYRHLTIAALNVTADSKTGGTAAGSRQGNVFMLKEYKSREPDTLYPVNVNIPRDREVAVFYRYLTMAAPISGLTGMMERRKIKE
jgi:hypothetical protein